MLIPLLAVSLAADAYNAGDRFAVDGITYEVRDVVNYEVRVVGISKPGITDVVVPATVFDGVDQTFSVKQIGAWTEAWSTDMETLTLSEGIEEIASGAAFCGASALINLCDENAINRHLFGVSLREQHFLDAVKCLGIIKGFRSIHAC